MQDNIEERAVDFQSAVVFNQAQFPEFIHKQANPRASGADHICQGFLADFWNDRLGLAFFPNVGEQQKNPGQPLLA